MKKYYHMTSLDNIRSISNTGLTPQNGDNSKAVNDPKVKVFFSEGMTGAVALFTNFQKHYDMIKSGNAPKTPKEIVEAIQNTETMEEYLGGEGVYLLFDGTEIENEKNFMDGSTSQIIPSENLQVCLLKNDDTNEVSYSRYDVIKYMMSKVPVESIHYFGKDIDEAKFEEATSRIQTTAKDYYKKHGKEIDAYKFGNYTMETVPVREFCKKYLSPKSNELTGQAVGKDTMPLLEDVEAVKDMERLLDKDVREVELAREATSKAEEKIRIKKDGQ